MVKGGKGFLPQAGALRHPSPSAITNVPVRSPCGMAGFSRAPPGLLYSHQPLHTTGAIALAKKEGPTECTMCLCWS